MQDQNSCSQCHHQIGHTANFCENCGKPFSNAGKLSNQLERQELFGEGISSSASKVRQNLIFSGLIILCASTVYYFLIGLIVKLTNEWSIYETLEPVALVVSFASGAIALLIALGMKPGNKKTVAIIFACVYALIHLYWLIDRLIPEDDLPFKFLEF